METLEDVKPGLVALCEKVQKSLDALAELQSKHTTAKAQVLAEVEQAKSHLEASKRAYEASKVSSLLDGKKPLPVSALEDAKARLASLEGILSSLQCECGTREHPLQHSINRSIQELSAGIESYCDDSMVAFQSLIRNNPIIFNALRCVGEEQVINLLTKAIHGMSVKGQLNQVPREFQDSRNQPRNVQGVLNNLVRLIGEQ